jgi:hypothetical protein
MWASYYYTTVRKLPESHRTPQAIEFCEREGRSLFGLPAYLHYSACLPILRIFVVIPQVGGGKNTD